MFLFFFFKEKTAYEMRISDWSSDVCSSDLIHQQAGRAGAEAALDQRIDLVGAERGDDGEEADGEEAGGVPHRPLAAQPLGQRERQQDEDAAGRDGGEIGRASCRARGCQYV